MPGLVVDPLAFYANTRRQRFSMKGLTTMAGLGSTDSITLRQTGIVAGLEVRVTGTLVFGGTITGTSALYDWPFNVVKSFVVSANGQSSLVNCRGIKIRTLEFIMNDRLDDIGVTKTFNGASISNGSLALPSDDWGTSAGNSLAPNSSVAATGTYTVDLTFFIPIAADPKTLVGSVFAQTSATNLTLDINWNTQAALFTLGGSATLTNNLQYQVTGLVYSIPNVGGRFVVPDLSAYHQIAEFQQAGLGQNDNLINLPGTGIGRKLLRLVFQTWTGATTAPLALNATNYNKVAWQYGGSDTPEQYDNGTSLAAQNIRIAGSNLAGQWGIGFWDFASEHALRDAVDEGQTSDLRLLVGLAASPTSGKIFTTQETLFAAPVGA